MSALESGPVRVPRPPRRQPHVARAVLPVVDETSAGGLVVDVVDGEAITVVIARRNRGGRLEWCLPKGHIERGETPSETAVREVFEETGIQGRAILHLATIDYWFAAADRRVHKLVHHFLLEAIGGDLTVLNDPDREAEEAAWVPLSTVASRLAYPNERRVVAAARDVLAGRP